MSDAIYMLAVRRFEQERSRAERPIHLTVQQLARAATTLGEQPAPPKPEARSDMDRALFPDDEVADLVAAIEHVRDAPALEAAKRAADEAIVAERNADRDSAMAKLRTLGLTDREIRALLVSFGG